MKQLMLFTKNETTANHLIEQGFPLVNKTIDGWTFMNFTDKNASMSEEDKANVVVTDRLCMSATSRLKAEVSRNAKSDEV